MSASIGISEQEAANIFGQLCAFKHLKFKGLFNGYAMLANDKNNGKSYMLGILHESGMGTDVRAILLNHDECKSPCKSIIEDWALHLRPSCGEMLVAFPYSQCLHDHIHCCNCIVIAKPACCIEEMLIAQEIESA